ncbi:HAMP domain-containing sensor histidine kinase [Pseudorhodobacter sp. E13]|uniref:sensor histidine kinase n=1 Tax=Pseudorhodobacter sp. E13 TaxID=2487931 RepID=UPI001F47BA08|nr:HAMP domain-containing sensor histidine kinase [Pseudorhodobacter sp. E13]
MTVDVWQTINQREALSLHLLAQSVVLMAVVVAAAGLLVWFGINLGLRPLLQLREAVALRSPDDLGPIRRVVPKEVRNLVAAMNSLFARLAEAFAARDAFISDAAHQLRNPVAAILAQAEAAATAPNPQEQKSRIAEVVETARRTGRLTQQLLSMEKARGRESSAVWRQVDLRALAEDRIKLFAEREMRNAITVSFAVTGQVQPLEGDPVMLAEAIENLLDNAARYGCVDGGDVALSLNYEGGQVALRVTDSGPGIPPEMQARVFDRFFRLAEDGSGGCGLGLAIVRKVAEAHGGFARVGDSASGTTIELILPLQGAGG